MVNKLIHDCNTNTLMRSFLLAFVVIFPFLSQAQLEYAFKNTPSADTRLVEIGEHTIVIQPLDIINQKQRWLTLDAAFNVVATKTFVNPAASNLIMQTYLQGQNSIIRIDQYLSNEQLVLTAVVFNAKGEIKHALDLLPEGDGTRSLLRSPFFIAQSPNKKFFVLLQPQIDDYDSLSVKTIVIDDTLNIKTNTLFTVSFDEEQFDIYMPLINDFGTVFLPYVDKFDSYRLNTVLNLLSVAPGSKHYKSAEFEFVKRKLKSLVFNTQQDTLFFTGLFSSKERREDVAGILRGGYALTENKKTEVFEYVYSDEAKEELKKKFGAEGRGVNILNHLSIKPGAILNNKNLSYGVLMPVENNIPNVSKKVVAEPSGLADGRQRTVYVASLIGVEPVSYPKRINAIDKLNEHYPEYIHTWQKSIELLNRYDTTLHNVTNFSQEARFGTPPVRGSALPHKYFLYFQTNKKNDANAYQFLKLKPMTDNRYRFFTHFDSGNGSGVLHYAQSGLNKPYLNRIFITNKGELQEKTVYEDKNKVIPQGYDFIIQENYLTAFYKNNRTGKMGLVKIRL